MAVLDNIFALFKDVKKVETCIYPNLKMKEPCIIVSECTKQVPTLHSDSSISKSFDMTPKTLRQKGMVRDECQVKRQYIEFIIDDAMDLSDS